jgi:hypothetical protein
LVRIQVLGTNKLSKSKNFAGLLLGKGFNDRVNLFYDSHNRVRDKVPFNFILAIKLEDGSAPNLLHNNKTLGLELL